MKIFLIHKKGSYRKVRWSYISFPELLGNHNNNDRVAPCLSAQNIQPQPLNPSIWLNVKHLYMKKNKI